MKHITVWIVVCCIPFCISPGYSTGPVTTTTKDQVHITVLMQHEIHFTYPFLLMFYCHSTTVILLLCSGCWSLSTVVSQGAIFAFSVLYVTPYDSWSSRYDWFICPIWWWDTPRELFFLYIHYVMRFSTCFHCFYVPFFPHSVHTGSQPWYLIWPGCNDI